MRIEKLKPRLLLVTSFVLGWVFGMNPLMHDGFIRGLTMAVLVGLTIASGMTEYETASTEL